MKLKFLIDTAKNFNDNTKRFLEGKYIRAWIGEIYCFLLFGCSPEDFYRYEFYKKSNYERNCFITYLRCQKIIRKYNDAKRSEIFRDKTEFNKVFKDFIRREWLDLRTSSQSEFQTFVEKHGEVFMKPLSGGQGKGIFLLTADKIADIDFESYRNYLAEEVLAQHPVMKQLNPSSVNTIRVLTFMGEIIACALRMGGDDSIVDNLRANGICAHMDMTTGIIDALCVDKTMKKYLIHPNTGTKLLGFEIPKWNDVKEIVEQAVKIVPEVGYIGWDVAITEDGVALIEGNHDPGHSVVQMITQTGLYKKVKDLQKGSKQNEI